MPLTDDKVNFFPDSSGWLVLSPTMRRGYTLTEAGNGTVIESFDLDSLTLRKRAFIPWLPIASDRGYPAGSSHYAGDIVHAVDPVARRIYLPVGDSLSTGGNLPLQSPDGRRMAQRFLVIDERAFDVEPGRAFGSFALPAAESRLLNYPLLGVRVTHEHVKKGVPGKLLAVYASPNPVTNLQAGSPLTGAFDHTLVQLDPGGIEAGGAPPLATSAPEFLAASDWTQLLYACGTAPMGSTGAGDISTTGVKNYQWEMLASRSAIYLGCQSAPMSGAVVRVALDEDAGAPLPGANQQIVALGKPVGDVMVDDGGKRLYLKSYGNDGVTWWAFDALGMRFAGSIAAGHFNGQMTAAGIDERTGRLYMLAADACVPRSKDGGALPVRGGFKIVDARLDPVPAAENVRPDLSYTGAHRIRIDPVTRRVFLRRGNAADQFQAAYPGCKEDVEAPVEAYYRVLLDNTPVAESPGELDDAPFTTNVRETKGLTEASFLGSGSGYGARVVLTGGLDAVSRGAVTAAQSPCGRDDRELLAGSVGNVEVSDQSTRADAASLDADSRTREMVGYPVSRCQPQAPPEYFGKENSEQLNRCHGVDVEEFAFDEVYVAENGETRDENKDGCLDRTGGNRYAVRCLQDEDPDPVRGPSTQAAEANSNPRHGFVADVRCSAPRENARGEAEGALAFDQVERFQADYGSGTGGSLRSPIRVARASAEVTVSREIGKGIKVTVDSIARGIELPGIGTIGVVRAEGTSTATGRDGRAKGTYRRTICDVNIGPVVVPGCIGDGLQGTLVKQLNQALSGRAEIRLRDADEGLLDGTAHGYLAAVQRDRKQLFGDQSITRDRSLGVPGLEIVLFLGDGGTWGAGRQIVQLAGVQAATSYGIICTFGQGADGQCAKEGEQSEELPDSGFGLGPGSDGSRVEDGDGASVDNTDAGDEPPAVIRVLRNIPRAIAEALRLLFNNPRELGLMAAVWALLYAPCYLGERRRRVAMVQGRRATAGGVG